MHSTRIFRRFSPIRITGLLLLRYSPLPFPIISSLRPLERFCTAVRMRGVSRTECPDPFPSPLPWLSFSCQRSRCMRSSRHSRDSECNSRSSLRAGVVEQPSGTGTEALLRRAIWCIRARAEVCGYYQAPGRLPQTATPLPPETPQTPSPTPSRPSVGLMHRAIFASTNRQASEVSG